MGRAENPDSAILVHSTESEHRFWLETWTAEIRTVLLASVLGEVDVAVFRDTNMFMQRLPHHAHTRLHRLPFAFAMILTMNARRFQRTHPLSGTGSALNASKDIGMGVSDIALVVNKNQ